RRAVQHRPLVPRDLHGVDPPRHDRRRDPGAPPGVPGLAGRGLRVDGAHASPPPPRRGGRPRARPRGARAPAPPPPAGAASRVRAFTEAPGMRSIARAAALSAVLAATAASAQEGSLAADHDALRKIKADVLNAINTRNLRGMDAIVHKPFTVTVITQDT